jgi:hypothetical protein
LADQRVDLGRVALVPVLLEPLADVQRLLPPQVPIDLPSPCHPNA